MSESKPSEGNLSDEFRNLGKNLADVLRAAWESPERRRLQQDIESGLAEMRSTLRKEAEAVSESTAGQRLKTEAADLRNRIRSGEAEARIREELVSALRTINTELEKVRSRMGTDQPQEQAGEERPGAASPWTAEQGQEEIHPDDVESAVDRSSFQEEIHPDDVKAEDDTPSLE